MKSFPWSREEKNLEVWGGNIRQIQNEEGVGSLLAASAAAAAYASASVALQHFLQTKSQECDSRQISGEGVSLS